MKKIVRDSNFELLRIVCMLMIIGGHIIMNHGNVYDFHNMDFPISLFVKGSFAVYLIHLHPCVWKHFCEVISVSSYHGCQYILSIVFLPFVIYATCAFLESIRVMLLGKVEDSLVVFVERRIMKQL